MPSTHIIRRQVLDVELVGTESDGLALQHKLMTLCQDWLMPALDRMLERALPPDQHWTLDRLEIDAGAINLETLERDLVDAVSQAMERRVKDLVPRAAPWSSSDDVQALAPAIERRFGESAGQLNPPQPVERRTGTQAVLDALAHFLTTGLLPWWFSLPSGETLEDVVRGSWQAAPENVTGAGRPLMAALASPAARTRLIRQFSADFLALLLARVAEEKVPVVREVLAELDRHHALPEALGRFRALVWQAAFAPGGRHTAGALAAAALHEATAANTEPITPSLLEVIERVWPETRIDRVADGASRRTPEPDAAAPSRQAEAGARSGLEEGVFIGGAGIVLLHPFLPRLFEGLGIAANDKLIAPDRALGLLHFLATGQLAALEYELLLPKILCNVPLDVPAAAPAALTTAEREEADALLSAVIGHWTALGDTSVDGLRGSFLARPGKLSRRGADDLLQVEPRSYDVLLDRLPWGIGMIQLPWMEKILRVEWRF